MQYPVLLKSAQSEDVQLKTSEIMRYMGCKNSLPDEQILDIVQKCISEFKSVVSYKACYAVVSIECKENYVEFPFGRVESKNLSKNLSGCNKAIIFVATAGSDVDRMILKYSAVKTSKCLVFDAVATTGIESFCDKINKEFKNEFQFLKPRFSPGYGDFDILHQKAFLQIADSNRKIGVSLTDGFLMTPTKSVSAVIGIGNKEIKCDENKCAFCNKKDCEFSKR